MMSIAYVEAPERVPAALGLPHRKLLIDGRQVDSVSGRAFKTLNPASEEVIATVAEGNEADVDRAVAAARRAFEGPWRTMRRGAPRARCRAAPARWRPAARR